MESAASAFEEYKANSLAQNQNLQKCGIFISIKDGFLVASPDGMVHDSNGACGLIEMKCPFSCRNMSASLPQREVFICEIIDEEIYLRKSHDYYFQIQGAMAIIQLQWCDFIVWTTKSMNVERIPFNQTFWNTCYFKLKSIYISIILPEIIYPRIPLDLDIIQYDSQPFSREDNEP